MVVIPARTIATRDTPTYSEKESVFLRFKTDNFSFSFSIVRINLSISSTERSPVGDSRSLF